MLALSLLGPFAASLEERPLTQFSTQKAQALLIYLAVEARQIHQREALMALLWPDSPQKSAQQSLRQTLYLLRQTIEPEKSSTRLILAKRFTVAVNHDALALDIDKFEKLSTNGSTPQEWQQAVDLYQDHFLADFYLPDSKAFEEWAANKRAFYQHRMQELLQRLIKHHLELGDIAAAETAVRRQLDLDNLQEAAHRQLMEILARNGRRQEALTHYDNVRQLLLNELGVEPDTETHALVEKIRKDNLETETQTPQTINLGDKVTQTKNNLPHRLTSFIGREKEIAEIRNLVASNRLVILTGTGGIGKTSLAIQIGHQLLKQFPDGIWLVELAPVLDSEHVVQTAVSTLGLVESPNRSPLDILLHFLRNKNCLLILDNCEHVLKEVVQLIESVLLACPDLNILASSRENLEIPAETTCYIPPLSLPDKTYLPTLENWTAYEATKLFVERATRAFPEYQVTPDNWAPIVQICQQLDGIPLALELAAARVNLLTTEQIASRLNDRFHLLTMGSRNALPRHQTLQAMVDWSWELLSSSEQTLLQRLSIFAGGMTLEAVESVCTGKGIKQHDILDLLTQLVSKSMVIAKRTQGRETRYYLLETIRQYGQDRLSETGNNNLFKQNHLNYFLKLAEQAEQKLKGPTHVIWLNQLKIEINNFRLALNWASNSDVEAGLKLAASLWDLWMLGGYVREGEEWLQHLLSLADTVETATTAKAMIVQSDLLVRGYKMEQAHSLGQKSLAIYRKLGDQWGTAKALSHMASLAHTIDTNKARKLYLESLAIFRSIDNKHEIALTLLFLGGNLEGHTCKNFNLAYSYLEESKALFQELENPRGIAVVWQSLGALAYLQEDYETALPLLEKSLEMREQLGHHSGSNLENLARLYYELGRYEESRDYFEKSLSSYNQTGHIYSTHFASARLGQVYLRLGELAQAESIFLQSLQEFSQLNNTYNGHFSLIGIVFAMENLASLATYREQPEQAIKFLAWTDATRKTLHDPRPPNEQKEVNQNIAAIQEMVDEEVYTAAYTEGRKMTLEEVIALALKN